MNTRLKLRITLGIIELLVLYVAAVNWDVLGKFLCIAIFLSCCVVEMLLESNIERIEKWIDKHNIS